MERGHYDVSRAVAETALLPAVRAADGAMVLADGFSCRTQLDQLAQIPAPTWPSCWPAAWTVGSNYLTA